jgi:hypothetical protein
MKNFFAKKSLQKNLVKSTAPMKIYGHYFIPQDFLGKKKGPKILNVFSGDVNVRQFKY